MPAREDVTLRLIGHLHVGPHIFRATIDEFKNSLDGKRKELSGTMTVELRDDEGNLFDLPDNPENLINRNGSKFISELYTYSVVRSRIQERLIKVNISHVQLVDPDSGDFRFFGSVDSKAYRYLKKMSNKTLW